MTAYADNHSAHRSHLVVDYCKEHGVDLQYLAPYSSVTNPQEHVWSQLKRYMGKQLSKTRADFNRQNFLRDLQVI